MLGAPENNFEVDLNQSILCGAAAATLWRGSPARQHGEKKNGRSFSPRTIPLG
jgi:hypothetical protein